MEASQDRIHEAVREHYAKAARSQGACCETECGCSGNAPYTTDVLAGVPADVSNFSLGCGDPITLASLVPGQRVLDLGSGGGLDCFLAAGKVGDTGRVIGVDMTPEMIDRARANSARMGIGNVEFRQGLLENLPVEDGTVDVVISNCVINLVPDKSKVFREMFRALAPGGRVAISDLVTNGALSSEIRESLDAWGACVAGALDARDYETLLAGAGFEDVKVAAKRSAEELPPEFPAGSLFSALVTARKPR